MQTFLKGKRVGYWLSEKKIKKLNFQAFAELCRKRGIEVVQLNLSRPVEEQGPLDVIIHKLTDVILEADQNDSQSLELVHRFQEYIDAHPETIVLDPLPAIRTLLDRSKSYELIRKIEAYMKDHRSEGGFGHLGQLGNSIREQPLKFAKPEWLMAPTLTR
ncbi:hypothetical protein E2I00_012280 [Balaenoptera physalus]|uniref:Inositol-tetrakisphosphate 1-kinase N-terminal domain-containing protein n=1 Tax=Balaenoptera physalus TaxID=9770 RepID=A0A643CCY8_BALPH|nr:hypothetical protein E2I00_012280 [Balaenoptera physalus]